MIRVLTAAILAGASALPCPASAQGAIEEPLEELGSDVRPVPERSILPRQIDLTATTPPPRSQGGTQSCTSWSTAYGAATQALRRARPGVPPLSPSFTYNQVSGNPYCQTPTKISSTLNLLRDVGALPIDSYAFDGGWCGRRPSAAERTEAAKYRIKGWRAFNGSNLNLTKTELAEGHVVIFSLPMGHALQTFSGSGVFAKDSEINGSHAMIAVGYDDARQAFRIQNSWGRGWGDGGYAWFGYDYWHSTVKSAFVIE